MAVIDATRLEQGSAIDTDICIVGAGAGGLTLAGSLESAGREVCVIEAGGFKPDEDTQALHDIDCIGYPVRENYMARARYYGGTCNLWAGRAMKLARSDIEDRPWLGEQGEGWPINYADMSRYYDDAAEVLGLPAVDALSYDGRMSADETALIDGGALLPNAALWARKPMRFGKSYRHLFKHGNYKLCTNANATEIVLDQDGQNVDSIVTKNLAGNEIRVRARKYVLAAGGLENARLLLASQQSSSSGIGNEHDLVGRYYMDHPRSVFGRIRLDKPVELSTVLGIPLRDGKVQLGLGLSEGAQRRHGVVNSYVSLEPEMSSVTEAQYRTSISVMKVLLRRGHAGSRTDWTAMRLGDIKDMIYMLTPKEILPHTVYRALILLKRRLYGNLSRGALTIVNYCEQLPDRESRVTLSADRDQLGVNKLALDWRVGSEVQKSIAQLHRALDERLRESGIGAVETIGESFDEVEFTDASHHMGTTRMSDDPRQGVVDSDCRVHGVANLYVTGSSVFPTCGNANPTWTIVALALRLGDHLR
jgi:choline dehydrogenase-like flavoprotein